jgi:hypothetical protein
VANIAKRFQTNGVSGDVFSVEIGVEAAIVNGVVKINS